MADDFNFVDYLYEANPQALNLKTGDYKDNESLFWWGSADANSESNVVLFATRLSKFLISIITVIALIGLLIAGYQYVSAMGEEEKVTKAKKRAIGSLLALLLAILSFSAINIIVKTVGQEKAATEGFQYKKTEEQGEEGSDE